VLYRVTQAKTARRAARAVGHRLAPWRVSRFMLALNDSAAALSALVPAAPRDLVTPSWSHRIAKSFDAYWAPLSLCNWSGAHFGRSGAVASGRCRVMRRVDEAWDLFRR